MSTRSPSDDFAPSESFAALFESEAKNKPSKRAGRRYSVGESVEGVVVRIGRDAVFLDLDGKREGYVDLIELRQADGSVGIEVGETLRAVVVDGGGEDGAIRLGKTAPKGRGAEGLISAQQSGLAVEGTVTGVNKGGLEVTVDGVRAFCPARAVDTRFVTDLATYVGQKLSFVVTQVAEGGRQVVLSRRALLEREQSEAREKLASKLQPGAVLRGRVISTRDFGAFVDLGGVEALLPGSEISHDRSVKPADLLKIGEEIDVSILEVKPDEKRPGSQRITLSLKALAGDPWESTAATLKEGSVVDGRVVRHTQFGAFVALAPGLDGLLHVSELSGEADQAKLPDVGATIGVRILKVDRAQRRIALAPAASEGRAVRTAKAMATIAAGMSVTGKVSAVERFGVFVQLAGGARGLLPAAELLRGKVGGDLNKLWPIGTDVTAKVVSVDGGNKIRLSIQALKDDEERASFEDFRQREQERSVGSMGALGQKLAQAGILAAGRKKK
jgi:small subunit ribosomal protein S1